MDVHGHASDYLITRYGLREGTSAEHHDQSHLACPDPMASRNLMVLAVGRLSALAIASYVADRYTAHSYTQGFCRRRLPFVAALTGTPCW